MKYTHNLAKDATVALGNDYLADVWLSRPSRLYDGNTPAEALSDPKLRNRVLSQLNWFSGCRKPAPSQAPANLQEVLSDPMIQMVLRSAGSSPEELVALYENAKQRHRAV